MYLGGSFTLGTGIYFMSAISLGVCFLINTWLPEVFHKVHKSFWYFERDICYSLKEKAELYIYLSPIDSSQRRSNQRTTLGYEIIILQFTSDLNCQFYNTKYVLLYILPHPVFELNSLSCEISVTKLPELIKDNKMIT